MTYSNNYQSPIGPLVITCTDGQINSIELGIKTVESLLPTPQIFISCAIQLDEYFSGTRSSFDIPIQKNGTPFQEKVWALIRTIPYGTTWSYSTCAKNLGKSSATRAIAHAIALNKVAIITPCHRIIGKNGSLTGYRYGIPLKRWLLEHEYQKNINRLS